MINKAHIIINPAAGQPQPILNTLNDVFHGTGVEWGISITRDSGDATRFAQLALEDGADVVASYGGDGTVMEVAKAVMGGQVPMAILPGGTANLMSVELGISKDLAQAAQIMIDPNSVVRRLDMGEVGVNRFMLRLGMGIAGEKVRLADRELKDRWGILAYSIAALKAIGMVKAAHYRVKVDGIEYEADARSCLIDNAGNIGLGGLKLSKQISVDDGLLDVILLLDSSVAKMIASGEQLLERQASDAFLHYQGREISVECDVPQVVQGDGEIWGETPINIQVLPGILPILTPGVPVTS